MNTKREIDRWLSKTSGRLYVRNTFYHHHAFEILNTHDYLKNKIIKSLKAEIPIEARIKKQQKKNLRGIKADVLNSEIRSLLKNSLRNDIKLEVVEDKGVFYFSSEKSAIGGFNFAILNHKKNISALRNLCFGELQYFEGDLKWSSFLNKNPELKIIAKELEQKDKLGIDIPLPAEDSMFPLIVGEIQFGNWALVYRDLFKVLKANVQNSIDCLIYIVPTNDLELMLSDGIVTFDKTVKILEEFSKVISVPVWVIGLDIKING